MSEDVLFAIHACALGIAPVTSYSGVKNNVCRSGRHNRRKSEREHRRGCWRVGIQMRAPKGRTVMMNSCPSPASSADGAIPVTIVSCCRSSLPEACVLVFSLMRRVMNQYFGHHSSELLPTNHAVLSARAVPSLVSCRLLCSLVRPCRCSTHFQHLDEICTPSTVDMHTHCH